MITVTNLRKSFGEGEKAVHVLKGIDLSVGKGEYIAIMGRSGAGKSTLMYQMSLLDDPTSGEIVIEGVKTHMLTNTEKTEFRLSRLGYVFQDYALLPELTAQENVALPLLMQGLPKKVAFAKAAFALSRVGLEHRLNNTPSMLSGGEQQRVSISRAVAHDPEILFADEPTANLDNESSKRVLDIFDELHKNGQTIIMVTHEMEYGKRAEKIIKIDDGRVVE
jgi:putative ABC transport system ATP-binding protein